MADSYGENAGNNAVALDSPIVNEKEVEEEEEITENSQPGKIVLSRSESCGSILQGNGMNKIRNLSRRVSFPSDDKLISGYNEPRNPWEHAHETTTEDLIQAYTQSCQTWNVRPITKLLVQLQEIKDFTVRANSLTLKGERIETRVVETLESIFKRVQFVTIDLEATNLDEDAGASLFDMIEYYESAVNVLVGFNKNLGNRGWQAAAHMMRKMSCLRLFDGHSVPLSIQASPFVGRALRLSNTLVTLHLENAMLSGRPVLLIVAALRMNTTLRELFLADNRLTPLDSLQLANLLKFNRVLQLLDLRNNPIQDMGLGHLCAGLMAQCGGVGLNGAIGGLQTLVLWNNQISQESMPKLAMALRYTVSLSTLNLGQNVLCDDGILKLKEGLLQNHSLLRLGLVGTKLTDEGAVAIAEYLAESPRIIRLDLRNNDIKVAGLMALSLAFKINHSLLRLDIDRPNKKDALKELAAKQESLMGDIISYAQRNKRTALEKAQALQIRQEEERQAHLREESGLRYMDMTNSSTVTSPSPPVTTEMSVNNSNNSPVTTQTKIQEAPVTCEKETDSIPLMSSDADDSPEDSPEFLPRSSVSYHQVAPVMLSGSEMAKRAAAAGKLQPVQEHLELEEIDPPQDFIPGATKLVSDAFIDAKEALTHENTKKEKPEVGKETVSNVNKPSTGSGDACEAEKVDCSNDKQQNSVLDDFAASLTASVLSSVTTNTGTDSRISTSSTQPPDPEPLNFEGEIPETAESTPSTEGNESTNPGVPKSTCSVVTETVTGASHGTDELLADDQNATNRVGMEVTKSTSNQTEGEGTQPENTKNTNVATKPEIITLELDVARLEADTANLVTSTSTSGTTCAFTQSSLSTDGAQVSIAMNEDILTVETLQEYEQSTESEDPSTLNDDAMEEEDCVVDLPVDDKNVIDGGDGANANGPIGLQESDPDCDVNMNGPIRSQEIILDCDVNVNEPITSKESVTDCDANVNNPISSLESVTNYDANLNDPISSQETSSVIIGAQQLEQISNDMPLKDEEKTISLETDDNGNVAGDECNCGTETQSSDILDNAASHEHAASIVTEILKDIGLNENRKAGDTLVADNLCNGNQSLDGSRGLHSAGDISKLDNYKTQVSGIFDNTPHEVEVSGDKNISEIGAED